MTTAIDNDASATTPCRDCGAMVSFSARACPHCGAPSPYEAEFSGWGYEWRSRQTLFGLPLVHVSFKYRPNRLPVVARGWLAVGQFSCGFVNVSQFGVGPFCLGQFSIAAVAVSQFAAAVCGICQVGVVYEGLGVVLVRLKDLF